MSSAFDTIWIDKLTEITEEFLEEDEMRIIRVLLSDTNLEIKIQGADTKPFKSNIGSPQGDAVSGPFSTIYLEHYLRKFREEVKNIPVNIYDINNQWLDQRQSNLPNELIYAGDYDFITEDEETKSMVIREVSKILASGNLQVNDTKTEVITLKRSNNDTEGWRKIKKLGSLLGDKENVKNRKRLANIAFIKLECIWLSRRNISVQRRVKLYNMLVKSILLYNCGTWGMTIQDEQQLDSFHRKQLRRILNIRWPHKIRNKKLYKKTISKPISIEVPRRR